MSKQLVDFFQQIDGARNHFVAMDLCHTFFIFGSALAKKPQKCLELGVGTGSVTLALINALAYNGRGSLTCVDNWADWLGVRPPFAANLEKVPGVRVVDSSERDFVYNCPSGEYDFLVSDADHEGDWFGEHLRIARDGGFLFFHDTNNPDCPAMKKVLEGVRERGLVHYHFVEGTRPDERCGRGLLFVAKTKERT